ncbi:MAG: AsmA family protein, partial [Verrucomicrobiae bacterium]|nr:AsmA family protein [Verrucomicrobiae bacterium]
KIGNNQKGVVTVRGLISQSFSPPPTSTNQVSTLSASAEGRFDLQLDESLFPTSIKGETRLGVMTAAGSFADLAKLTGQLSCEITPTEVRELALRFERDGRRLGQIRLRGPIDMAKRDARITLEVVGVDHHVLNLFGAPFGLDFGDVTVGASALVDVSQRMSVISATGKGTVSRFSLRRADIATPPVDVDFEYQFNLNLNERSAIVHKFNLAGKARNQELLRASLDRSLNLSWGQNIHGVNESVVSVQLANLNLPEWKMLLGTNVSSGVLSASARLTFQNDGRRIPAELKIQAKDLTAVFGTNSLMRLTNAALNLEATALITDFRSVLADHYYLELVENQEKLLTASGSAGYDLVSKNANLQINLDTEIAAVLERRPVPKVSVSSGRASLNALLSQEKSQQRLSAKLALNGLTGAYGEFALTNYEAKIESDAEITTKLINLRRVAFSGNRVGSSGGTVEIAGRYDRIFTNAEIQIAVMGLNQNCLEPLLARSIMPNQLSSISVSGSASAKYQPNSETSIKLETEISQFAIKGPDGLPMTPPLDVKVGLDAVAQTPFQYTVRKLELALPPTPNASNVIQLQAKVDLSPTNPTPTTVRVLANALDLGPVYDAFMKLSAARQTTKLTRPESEPEPFTPPVAALDASVQIDKLFLRELHASNIVATARLNRGVLRIEPCNLVLNGAPISATANLDLTRPGYAYEFSAKTTNLPIQPLLSLSTNQTRRVSGNLSGSLQIKGAGTTLTNLIRNLTGQFDIGSTNLNIPVAEVKNPILKSVIDVILALPDIVRRPDAALVAIIGSLTGTRSASAGSWLDQLTEAPIDTILFHGKAANGLVNLDRGLVQSTAFQAEARGSITLAPAFTNSALNIPVAILLRRSLAERASLLPDGAPTNTAFVRLPDFLTIKGTAGDPKADINKLALASLTLKAGAGIVGQSTGGALEKAANIVGAVGNLIGGTGTTSTNAPAQTTTNVQEQKPILPLNPLDLFKRK